MQLGVTIMLTTQTNLILSGRIKKFRYLTWHKNKFCSELIWDVFQGEPILVLFNNGDSRNEAYFEENYDYYLDTYSEEERKDWLISKERLKFSVLDDSIFYSYCSTSKSLKIENNFQVIKPHDLESLEVILTLGNQIDESIHIFSESISSSILKKIFKLYFSQDDKKYYISLKGCFLDRLSNFPSPMTCLINTYRDDEDDKSYYLISNDLRVYSKYLLIC